MAPKKQVTILTPADILGVAEGAEVVEGTDGWDAMTLPQGSVLEVGVAGSSVGFGTDEWFAVLITSMGVSVHGGALVGGELLGAESASILSEAQVILREGKIHLCQDEPCALAHDTSLLHATKVRCWTAANFSAEYLTDAGRKLLAAAIKAGQPRRTKAKAKPGDAVKKPRRGETVRPAAPARRSRTGGGDKPGRAVIDVPSGEEEETPEGSPGAGVDRAQLRSILKETRERIMGDPPATKRRRRAAGLSGGPEAGDSSLVPAKSPMIAGTSLKPGQQSMMALDLSADTSAGGVKKWKKDLGKRNDSTSLLLAQAVQSSEREAKRARDKKKSEKKDPLKRLARLLTGESSKKRRSRKKKRRSRRGEREPSLGGGYQVKPDPDGSEDPDESDYSSSSSSGGGHKSMDDSEEGSELSYEPPLRRRATRSPGSVMEMLIKHAQDQLDRGSLLEAEGARPGLTSGVKVGTYFALLIRPYYPAGSPLLRELYALGQAIDLLRAGRLAETADALAGRFVAVHTALAEGNWTTASQLELYPLEPIQSASVATMLQAQRHKKLVQKSQGITTGRWGGGNYGKGKGGGWNEKGRKGDQKGKPKGGGRGAGKGQNWQGKKGEPNPWKETQEEAPKK